MSHFIEVRFVTREHLLLELMDTWKGRCAGARLASARGQSNGRRWGGVSWGHDTKDTPTLWEQLRSCHHFQQGVNAKLAPSAAHSGLLPMLFSPAWRTSVRAAGDIDPCTDEALF